MCCHFSFWSSSGWRKRRFERMYGGIGFIQYKSRETPFRLGVPGETGGLRDTATTGETYDFHITFTPHSLFINQSLHTNRHVFLSLYIPLSAFTQCHRGRFQEGQGIHQLFWWLISRHDKEFRLDTHLLKPLQLKLLWLLPFKISGRVVITYVSKRKCFIPTSSGCKRRLTSITHHCTCHIYKCNLKGTFVLV